MPFGLLLTIRSGGALLGLGTILTRTTVALIAFPLTAVPLIAFSVIPFAVIALAAFAVTAFAVIALTGTTFSLAPILTALGAVVAVRPLGALATIANRLRRNRLSRLGSNRRTLLGSLSSRTCRWMLAVAGALWSTILGRPHALWTRSFGFSGITCWSGLRGVRSIGFLDGLLGRFFFWKHRRYVFIFEIACQISLAPRPVMAEKGNSSPPSSSLEIEARLRCCSF